MDFIRENGSVAGVKIRTKSGGVERLQAPMTIDCSGREALGALRNQWRVGDPELHKVAVWTYYKGAKRDEGIDAVMTKFFDTEDSIMKDVEEGIGVSVEQ